MIEKIDHIAIAVDDLEEGLRIFQGIMGLRCISKEIIEKQKVKVAKLALAEITIELLEPLDHESTIAKFLIMRGPGFHHLAFKSSNLDQQIENLESNSINTIRGVEKGAGGARVAFVQPKQTLGVLMELTDGGLEHEGE